MQESADVRDPRVARSISTIRETAIGLFLEGGPRAVTVDEISARSGVAKTTIYRHWRDRNHLLADLYSDLTPKLDPPSEGLEPEDALRQVVGQLVAEYGRWPVRQALPFMLATLFDSRDSQTVPSHVWEVATQRIIDAVATAAKVGVIPADTDLSEAKHEIVGFVVMTAIDFTCSMDEALADRIVDLFIAGRCALAGSRLHP